MRKRESKHLALLLSAVTCLSVLFCVFLFTIGVHSALASNYDPHRAGHPVRIVAYFFHPVGVLLDYCLMRPAYHLGQHEPLTTIFGVPTDPRKPAHGPDRRDDDS